jgi:tetratricopeptide (TPR) repeat protein
MKNFMILLLTIFIASCAQSRSGYHGSMQVPKTVDSSKLKELTDLREPYIASGRYQEAFDVSNKLIELMPDNALFYLARGEAYEKLDNYASAIADYEKALSMDRGDLAKKPPLYFNIGTAYLNWGKNAEAITYFDKALKLDRRYVQALVHRGVAYHNTGKFDLAKTDFDGALSLDANNALAYRYRANIYGLANNYGKVVADLSKCLELDPKRYSQEPAVFGNRGVAYHELEKLKEALEDFDRAISLNPRYVFALVNRGRAYSDLKKYDLALKDFDMAIGYEPNNTDALFWRGGLYYSTDKLAPALEDFMKVVKVNPRHIVAHLLITGVYSRQNSIDEACRWLRKTIAVAKETGFSNWNYLKTGKEFEGVRKASCYNEVIQSK